MTERKRGFFGWTWCVLWRCALLLILLLRALLLPGPRSRDARNLTPYLSQRVAWVERQMQQLGAGYLNPILN